MDNLEESLVNKIKQVEDENAELKHHLMMANRRVQLLERNNHRTTHDRRACPGLVVADSGAKIDTPESSSHFTNELATNEEIKLPQEGKLCAPLKFETLSWCEERKREVKSTEDERRLRHLLCQAISKNARMIASALPVYELLDHLFSKFCITEDEYRKFSNMGKSIDLARTVLALVLRRDCLTLLSFIDILFDCFAHIASGIADTYDNIVKNGSALCIATGPLCSHCLLLERVEPILFIDVMISHDYATWLPFYEQVANCNDHTPEMRREWWNNFMSYVNKVGASAVMTSLLIDAVEECKFHSDILKNLLDDQNKNVDSFICKHTRIPVENLFTSPCTVDVEYEPRMDELKVVENGTTNLKIIQNSTKTSVNTLEIQKLKSFDLDSQCSEEYAYEPRMQELKEVDHESTKLKMIQTTTKSSAVKTDDNQRLTPFVLEFGEREMHTSNDSRHGQEYENTTTMEDENSTNASLAILFITNSDITIKSKGTE